MNRKSYAGQQQLLLLSPPSTDETPVDVGRDRLCKRLSKLKQADAALTRRPFPPLLPTL